MSRALSSAIARRTNQSAPPISGNRPGASMGYLQNVPQSAPNVRVVRGQPSAQIPNSDQPRMRHIQPPQPPQQQPQQYMTQQYMPQQPSNKLPFNKLSVSDAIGLITQRLGRVEVWMYETEHEKEQHGSVTALPTDNSVLTTLINRIEVLEKKANTPVQAQVTNNSSLDELIKLVDKHTIDISKCNEQLFKYNRDFSETRDIVKSFMVKYDLYVNQVNEKFTDYENALIELEKNMQPASPSVTTNEIENNIITNQDPQDPVTTDE